MAYIHRLDNKTTKYGCCIGLTLAWIVFAVAIATGVKLMRRHESQAFSIHLSPRLKEVLPLLFNVGVTVLNESMGFIHTCTLRWSLYREGRLDFSSNLRLLSFSRTNYANGWFTNIFYIVGIVLTYASTSTIFLSLNEDLYRTLYDAGGARADALGDSSIHINPFAVLALGIGMFLQASITTWAWCTTTILSWSSHPLEIARVCKDGAVSDGESEHRIRYQPGRCMMGVHMRKDAAADKYPTSPQKPMRQAHSYVIWIVIFLIALPVLALVWGLTVYLCIYFNKSEQFLGVLGKSWSFLSDLTGTIYGTDNGTNAATNTTADDLCHAASCTTGSSVLNIKWSSGSDAPGPSMNTLLVVVAFQGILTFALHCAELLVNLSRDEDAVRKLESKIGSDTRETSIVAAIMSWKTLLLFAFKASIHWVFGLALNVSYRIGICMYPAQIFYFMGFCSVTAAFGVRLAMCKCKGYLPSTYGHIQTIVNLIDYWTDTGMFWGHKYDEDEFGRCFAGTDSKFLGPPQCTKLYGGSGRARRPSRSSRTSYQQGAYDGAYQMHTIPLEASQGRFAERDSPPPSYHRNSGHSGYMPSPAPSPGLYNGPAHPVRTYRSNGSMGCTSDGSSVPLTSTQYKCICKESMHGNCI